MRLLLVLAAILIPNVHAVPCTSTELGQIEDLKSMKLPIPCRTTIAFTNSNLQSTLFSTLESNERMGLCSSPLCLSWIQEILIPSCDEAFSYSIAVDTIQEVCAMSYSVTKDSSRECTLYDNEMSMALPAFAVWKNCSQSLGHSATSTLLDFLSDDSICSVDACRGYLESLVTRSPDCYRVGSRGAIVNAREELVRQLPACWRSS